MKEKNLKKLFGFKVQQLRHLKGLTQDELAEAIDRSVDTISNIERGFSSTRIETASHLAKALGVSLPEMFEFSGSSEDKSKTHRKEVERLMALLMQCPAQHLPVLSRLVEQAVQLTHESE
ncbi:MAG: helix-turn-helix transcriptional regulator [Alphaproteobacteria bacterium]|nr:helix-turn-helix transcriptional regulator [Alphaproteobacteria bacterium]